MFEKNENCFDCKQKNLPISVQIFDGEFSFFAEFKHSREPFFFENFTEKSIKRIIHSWACVKHTWDTLVVSLTGLVPALSEMKRIAKSPCEISGPEMELASLYLERNKIS